MKHIILGMIGTVVVLYTIVSGLGVYNTRVRYAEMENALSQVVKQTLECGYGQENSSTREELLVEEIRYRMGSDSEVEVVIHCLNMEKGIISVTVIENFRQLNGLRKELKWTKTAIME